MTEINVEFCRFNACVAQLRNLYRETISSFNDSASALDSSELELAHELLHQPPTLLVLGRSSWARAQLTNALLRCDILPAPTGTAPWRPVRLKFAATALAPDLAAPVPESDLLIDAFDAAETLEVSLKHPLLRDGAGFVVAEGAALGSEPRGLPICLYALQPPSRGERHGPLAQDDARDIQKLRGALEQGCRSPPAVVLFVCATASCDRLASQLRELGFPLLDADSAMSDDDSSRSELLVGFATASVAAFVRRCLQRALVRAATLLNDAHCQAINRFILLAYDLSRELLLTPQKLSFAHCQEQKLYDSLCDIAEHRQAEMRRLVRDTLAEIRDDLLLAAEEHQFAEETDDTRRCTGEIRELLMTRLRAAVGEQLLRSITMFRDAYAGTLSRCLESLEDDGSGDGGGGGANGCSATDALRRIMNAAYQVELTASAGSSASLLDLLRELANSMPWSSAPKLDAEWRRRVAQDTLAGLSEHGLARRICGQLSERIRAAHEAFQVAMGRLEQRTAAHARTCEEQRDRIRSHHAPRIARLALESASVRDMVLYGMPQFSREIGRGQYGVVYSCDSWAGRGPVAVKSVVPPDDRQWDDLALEFYYAKQLPPHDRIVPVLGVVINYAYGCHGPSNGSGELVLSQSGESSDGQPCGRDASPEIRIVSEFLVSDLHRAIQTQALSFCDRLQVACDVVEGIRFLHSRGLVHRDVKLKNVLLDRWHRAKLADLGFCKPHAMMSGSIVGTPIHMPPELLSGSYDRSVDVYAFGILFWHLCADTVRLPRNFERCACTATLWASVRQGLRPERLDQFTDGCWDIMRQCWDAEPDRRPLPGALMPALQEMRARAAEPDGVGQGSALPRG